MPERLRSTPGEFEEEERPEKPRLRKVYDADEEEKREKSKAAVSGLKKALSEEGQKERAEREKRARLDKVSEGWKEIEEETERRVEKEQRTKTALKGLREALGKKEETPKPDAEEEEEIEEITDFEEVAPEPSSPAKEEPRETSYTPEEEAWFQEGRKMSAVHKEGWKEAAFEPGIPSSKLAPTEEQEKRFVMDLQDSAQRLVDVEQVIRVKFPLIDLESETLGVVLGHYRFRKAREREPDLFARYDKEKAYYDRLLRIADKYGVFTGKTRRSADLEAAKRGLNPKK